MISYRLLYKTLHFKKNEIVKLNDFHNQFHDCKENLFSNHINFKDFNFNFNSSNKTSKEKH